MSTWDRKGQSYFLHDGGPPHHQRHSLNAKRRDLDGDPRPRWTESEHKISSLTTVKSGGDAASSFTLHLVFFPFPWYFFKVQKVTCWRIPVEKVTNTKKHFPLHPHHEKLPQTCRLDKRPFPLFSPRNWPVSLQPTRDSWIQKKPMQCFVLALSFDGKVPVLTSKKHVFLPNDQWMTLSFPLGIDLSLHLSPTQH